MLNKQFKFLILSVLFTLNVLGSGTYIKGPALIEGFTTITSAAGTTTLTVASETKQIVTGATTQTIVMPDATTLPLGRKFLIINKSSGNVTVNDGSGGLLVTVAGGTQAEVHLRTKAIAAGVWDVLESSAGGGGGTWGSITGTLSDQTDLQTALDAKADENNPGFAGTIGTTITASRLLVTDGSSNLAASATTATEAGYLSGVTGGIQTQLDAKQLRSTLTTKGDLYVATASATTARQGVGTNGQTLIADSAATNGIRYKTPLVDNFIKNGDAESVTPIVTYADAAGTRPVDGTGGSPSVTTSISSTAPLADTNSFLLTKGASNLQGNGWSIPFTIPNSMKAKVAQIELDYIVNSGTFAAGSSSSDGDLIVYIYDVTNSTLIEPSSIKFLSSSTATSDRIVTNFQTSATGTSYNLILHVASTSASAWELKADNFQVKPSQYVYGTPITDWKSTTFTLSNAGNATVTGFERRVGDSKEFKAKVTIGATLPTGNIFITIPSGNTIDTAKLESSGLQSVLGEASAVRGNLYTAIVSLNNSTQVSMISHNTSNVWNATVPATWANGDTFNASFIVPIVGLSSSAQVSDGYDGRQIVLTSTSGTATLTSSYSDVTLTTTKDTTASYSGATYTIPSAGFYKFKSQAKFSSSGAITATNAIGLQITKNGSAEKTVDDLFLTTTAQWVNLYHEAYLNAGDLIKLQAKNQNASPTGTYSLYIEKLQSPTTISATEVVAARYYLASNTAFLTGTVQVPYDTKVYDTHNAYSTSTFKYTAPAAGFYRIGITFNTTASLTETVAYRIDATTSYFLGTSAGVGRFNGSDTFYLNAGQTVEPMSAGSGGTYAGGATGTFFTIERIK